MVGQNNNYTGAPAGGFQRRNLDDVTCFKVCINDLIALSVTDDLEYSVVRRDTTQISVRTVTYQATVVVLIVPDVTERSEYMVYT
jgi:hypothetical protein